MLAAACSRLQLATSSGQFLLLAGAAWLGRGAPGALAFGLLAAVSIPAWVAALKRARAIADMPTARITSAAQGYVELYGTGKAPDGPPLQCPASHQHCLWYRYRIERREHDKWVIEASGESDSSFVLDDGSGQCLVDPEGAEILAAQRERWTAGGRRYTQWLLAPGRKIYVLGRFHTVGTVELEQRIGEDVKATLADWKADPERLRARFDADGDGGVDLAEWDEARRAARAEVLAAHRDARRSAEAHVVRAPRDGRPYLIASRDPQRLADGFRWWARLHLAGIAAGVAGCLWMLR